MVLSDAETLKVLSVCNLVITFKYFMTIVSQGANRTRAPEDGFQPSSIRNAYKKDDNKQQLVEKSSGSGKKKGKRSGKYAFDVEKRWQRIVLNDLENVLMGIIMMWLSYQAKGNNSVTAFTAVIFVVARCLYTICYVYQLFPARPICWLLALLSTLVMAVNVCYGAFK